MSDLQREALKKRIGIPPLPSMAGKTKRFANTKLYILLFHVFNGVVFFSNTGGMRRKRDYSPLSWEEFFDRKDDIQVNGTDVSLSRNDTRKQLQLQQH